MSLRVPALSVLCFAAITLASAGELRAERACAPPPATALPKVSAALPPGPQETVRELVLALPKNEDGSLHTDGLRFAEGVRIVSSRWSPILCATLAVVVGPSDLAMSAWIPSRPERSVVVDNDRYYTANETTPREVPDPYRPLQHGLDQIGVERARAISEGRGVRVAVIDSAPDLSHPELSHVEAASSDALPELAPAVHGTLITGVIAAARGNGIGIAGVAPAAQVLAVPVCRPTAAGQADECVLYDMLTGLDEAFAWGARVMNLSLMGPPNPLLHRATIRLDELGVLLVAAAGNEGSETPRYPAAYASVIGVGAIDADGALWPKSNRGASAEIHAPGVEIVTTTPGGRFAFSDGTSLATAHVSGVLALLLGADADPVKARRALFRSGHASTRATRDRADLAPVCEGLALLGRPCAQVAAKP